MEHEESESAECEKSQCWGKWQPSSSTTLPQCQLCKKSLLMIFVPLFRLRYVMFQALPDTYQRAVISHRQKSFHG